MKTPDQAERVARHQFEVLMLAMSPNLSEERVNQMLALLESFTRFFHHMEADGALKAPNAASFETSATIVEKQKPNQQVP